MKEKKARVEDALHATRAAVRRRHCSRRWCRFTADRRYAIDSLKLSGDEKDRSRDRPSGAQSPDTASHAMRSRRRTGGAALRVALGEAPQGGDQEAPQAATEGRRRVVPSPPRAAEQAPRQTRRASAVRAAGTPTDDAQERREHRRSARERPVDAPCGSGDGSTPPAQLDLEHVRGVALRRAWPLPAHGSRSARASTSWSSGVRAPRRPRRRLDADARLQHLTHPRDHRATVLKPPLRAWFASMRKIAQSAQADPPSTSRMTGRSRSATSLRARERDTVDRGMSTS